MPNTRQQTSSNCPAAGHAQLPNWVPPSCSACQLSDMHRAAFCLHVALHFTASLTHGCFFLHYS
jgi:hypothetical protein